MPTIFQDYFIKYISKGSVNSSSNPLFLTSKFFFLIMSPSSSGGLLVAFEISRHSGMYDVMSGLPWARNLISKVNV